MGFNSAFKGLTASDFTLERGGGSVVGRGLAGVVCKLLHHTHTICSII